MATGYPDFEGGKRNLYLVPTWAAEEGLDKTFVNSAAAQGWGGFTILNYTVPAGKTLYIVGFSFYELVDAAADYDHFLHVIAQIQVGGVTRLVTGGLTGRTVLLPVPFVVVATAAFQALAVNRSNVTCTIGLSAWGYEV